MFPRRKRYTRKEKDLMQNPIGLKTDIPWRIKKRLREERPKQESSLSAVDQDHAEQDTRNLQQESAPDLVTPCVQHNHLGGHTIAGLVILKWYMSLCELDSKESGQRITDAVPLKKELKMFIIRILSNAFKKQSHFKNF